MNCFAVGIEVVSGAFGLNSQWLMSLFATKLVDMNGLWCQRLSHTFSELQTAEG